MPETTFADVNNEVAPPSNVHKLMEDLLERLRIAICSIGFMGPSKELIFLLLLK